VNSATDIFSRKFASYLLNWWEENKKSYPFRETSDPYRVLISEILLRKTRVKQVVAVYDEFFERFPDPCSISSSSPEEIAGIIKPLGLVSRANQIFKICGIICKERGGKIPSTVEELKALPGVGRYIANAVLAIGFGNPKPMVDSNVKRVLSRILGLNSLDANSDQLWCIYNEILQRNTYRHIHFAIIDLAHQLCLPSKPHCSNCPMKTLCHYCGTKRRELHAV
jgi:A/G-specific adenine glycosylase